MQQESKSWGIDLTGCKMRYEPWTVDNNGKYRIPTENEIKEIYGISGEAVNETLLYFEECNDNFTSSVHESLINIYDYKDFNPIVGIIIIDGEKNYFTFDHLKHKPHIGVLFLAEIFNSDKNISFTVSGPNLTIEVFVDIVRLYVYNSRSIDYVLETDVANGLLTLNSDGGFTYENTSVKSISESSASSNTSTSAIGISSVGISLTAVTMRSKVSSTYKLSLSVARTVMTASPFCSGI